MDETPDCARVVPLLAELATGAATGHERALALRHAAGCPSCRAELADLSRVADDLLLLAPLREPPAGFESAVMRRLDPAAAGPGVVRRRSRPVALRLVAAAAALVLAVGAGAAAESWRTAPDRRLADEYRRALAEPAGQGPRSAALTTDSGAVVGTVYLYPGTPAWVMVTITNAPEPGDYAMDVVTVDGVRYPAGVCPVTGRTGTIGYSLPVPVTSIATIELSRPGLRMTVHPR
jgi:hypothetical protein